MGELKVESWTNSIGQTINPGDDVVFVSKSTGSVGMGLASSQVSATGK